MGCNLNKVIMELGKKIEELVNTTTFNAFATGYYLSTIHRHLQSCVYRMVYHFLINLAHNYRTGNYDGRNEDACRDAAKMIEGLEEREDELYNLFSHMYNRK